MLSIFSPGALRVDFGFNFQNLATKIDPLNIKMVTKAVRNKTMGYKKALNAFSVGRLVDDTGDLSIDMDTDVDKT